MTTFPDLLAAGACRYDALALGEVMLRLDPGEGRIRTARSFSVHEGGGEYNVIRGLRTCFGLRSAVAGALVDNEVGRLIESLILSSGVDASLLKWIDPEGAGASLRNGLNFTERGFGLRGSIGVADRSHTAASAIRPRDFDWEGIFSSSPVRWFHTGGVFAALGEATGQVAIEAMQAAKRHGAVVSYDLNYRPSLWKNAGGLAKAQELNRRIALHADVLFGVLEGEAKPLCSLDDAGVASVREGIEATASAFPNLKVIATPLRVVVSASGNDWGGICWAGGEFHEAPRRHGMEILDRVGGGDSFASGIIYGFLSGAGAGDAVNLGTAHGALAMTTPGDNSMVSLAEVLKLSEGGSAAVER
jgi:2-dehydro-3-deoxygluconokinase